MQGLEISSTFFWKHLRFAGYLQRIWLWRVLRRGTCFYWGRACLDIFLLNFWWFYPPWLVDYVRTFWYVPFCHFWSIFSSAILAFDVMIIVRPRRRRQIGQVASFLFKSFNFSHLLHCILELTTLGLPLGSLRIGFFCKLWFLRYHFFNFFFRLSRSDIFFFLTFTNFFVFPHTIWSKTSSTKRARNKFNISFFNIKLIYDNFTCSGGIL